MPIIFFNPISLNKPVILKCAELKLKRTLTVKKKKSKQVKKVIKDTCFYYEIKAQELPLIRENREELLQMTPPLLPLKLQGTAYSSQVTIKLVNFWFYNKTFKYHT